MLTEVDKMPVLGSSRQPVEFNQADTVDLALEIRQLRALRFPINLITRVSAVNTLRAFAVEWSVPFAKFELEDYISSDEKFEIIKGGILKKMRVELSKLSGRDRETLKEVLSGFGAFDFEQAEKL